MPRHAPESPAPDSHLVYVRKKQPSKKSGVFWQGRTGNLTALSKRTFAKGLRQMRAYHAGKSVRARKNARAAGPRTEYERWKAADSGAAAREHAFQRRLRAHTIKQSAESDGVPTIQLDPRGSFSIQPEYDLKEAQNYEAFRRSKHK